MNTPKCPGAHIWWINRQIRWQIYPQYAKHHGKNFFWQIKWQIYAPKMPKGNFL